MKGKTYTRCSKGYHYKSYMLKGSIRNEMSSLPQSIMLQSLKHFPKHSIDFLRHTTRPYRLHTSYHNLPR